MEASDVPQDAQSVGIMLTFTSKLLSLNFQCSQAEKHAELKSEAESEPSKVCPNYVVMKDEFKNHAVFQARRRYVQLGL